MDGLRRRDVISAAGAATLCAAIPAGAMARIAPALRIAAFDAAYGPSRLFAAEARRLGIATQDTRGDMSALYVDHLMHRGLDDAAAVAGFTPLAQLFTLRLMAETPHFRLAFLHQHGAETGAAFGSTVARGHLQAATVPAPVAAAQLFAGWFDAAPAGSNIGLVDDRGLPGDTLVAWIIAPVRRSNLV